MWVWESQGEQLQIAEASTSPPLLTKFTLKHLKPAVLWKVFSAHPTLALAVPTAALGHRQAVHSSLSRPAINSPDDQLYCSFHSCHKARPL